MGDRELIEGIVQSLWDDVTDRRGWRQAADEFDDEVCDEIRATWTAIISEALSGPPEREGRSTDGPHKINDHRRSMARWLMDSKLDDDEAYGCVAFHPCITDQNKALSAAPKP